MIADMKNRSTFAVSQTKGFYEHENAVAFFMATCLSLFPSKVNGLSNRNGLLHSCINFSWSRCGAIALFIFNTSIFHCMTKRNEKCTQGNNSTRTRTSSRKRNSVSLQAFNTEKNAKNEAFAFILHHNLSELFKEFCRATKRRDKHELCLTLLSEQI